MRMSPPPLRHQRTQRHLAGAGVNHELCKGFECLNEGLKHTCLACENGALGDECKRADGGGEC